MKLFTLIIGYSLFSLYLPACEKCVEDMENTIVGLQYRMENIDEHWKIFFLGEINGLKIASDIYRINHED